MPSRDRLGRGQCLRNRDREESIGNRTAGPPGITGAQERAGRRWTWKSGWPTTSRSKTALKAGLEDLRRPSLAFSGAGARLHNPFKPENEQPTEKPFGGKSHPTSPLRRQGGWRSARARAAHLRKRARASAFETDAVDDYFHPQGGSRRRSRSSVYSRNGKSDSAWTDYTGPNLADGRANVTLDLPEE